MKSAIEVAWAWLPMVVAITGRDAVYVHARDARATLTATQLTLLPVTPDRTTRELFFRGGYRELDDGLVGLGGRGGLDRRGLGREG